MSDVDLKDIVNTAITVVDLLKSNVVQAMPALASALPRGIDAMTTDPTWSSDPRTITAVLTYPCAHPLPEPLTIADNVLKIGVRWNYLGQVGGKGRYIKDAEAFVIVENINPTLTFDVAVKFAETGTPISASAPDEPVAMLSGSFTVRVSSLLGVLFTQFYGVRLFGNGAGRIEPLG
jgi:hypothetical protein